MGPPQPTVWLDRLREARAAVPDTWSLPHDAALQGLYAGTRREPGAVTRSFRDVARLWEAHGRDELALDDTASVARRAATVGRHLAASLLPPSLAEEARAQPWTALRVETWLRAAARATHVEVAARCAAALEALGDAWYARLGASLCLDDLRPPPGKAAILRETLARVAKREAAYLEGVCTDGERYNHHVDRYAEATERIERAALEALPGTPLEAFVRTRRSTAGWRALHALVGLVARRDGCIVERAILPSLAEGLDAHDLMTLAAVRRGGELAARRRDVAVAALFGDLRAALGGLRVTARDCGAVEGAAFFDEPETDGPLADRVRGRTLARSSWRCRAREGVCARCYSRDPDDGTEAQPGDPVGLRAAWAIASVLWQLPGVWRTHRVWGGTSQPVTTRNAPRAGVVALPPGLFARGVALRPGRVTVAGDNGRAEEVVVRAGDRLAVADGARVATLDPLVSFDPTAGRVHVAQLPAETRATVALDLHGGTLYPLGGAADGRWLVGGEPAIDHVTVTLAAEGAVAQTLHVPRGATLRVRDGDVVEAGDALAVERQLDDDSHRYEDSLEGLRAALDLAPGGHHGRPAVFAPFDGAVVGDTRQRVTLAGRRGERFTSRGGYDWSYVRAGDEVLRGDVLVEGSRSLARLLRYRGERYVFDAIVRRFEEAAAWRGLALAPVHAELVARAMLDWRRVRRPGGSGLRRGAVVPRAAFEAAMADALARGVAAPVGVTVVRGLGALAGRRWKVSHEERMRARAWAAEDERRAAAGGGRGHPTLSSKRSW